MKNKQIIVTMRIGCESPTSELTKLAEVQKTTTITAEIDSFMSMFKSREDVYIDDIQIIDCDCDVDPVQETITRAEFEAISEYACIIGQTESGTSWRLGTDLYSVMHNGNDHTYSVIRGFYKE